MSTKVTTAEPQESETTTSIESALIQIVQRTDIDPERLEKFLDLQIKMENRQAERAFNDALAAFQGECPVITKNKKTSFTSKSGSTTAYDYAPLDEIISVIKPIMAKHGLSYAFDLAEGDMTSKLLTTIFHRDGFSKTYTYAFDTIHDDARMNSSQRRKSSLTYAKRAGLENALGLVTTGEDDDARRATNSPITPEQIAQIKDLMPKASVTEAQFFDKFKLTSYDEMDEALAKKAIFQLKARRAQCTK